MTCSFHLVPPASLRADRGQQHGRTIPLAVMQAACSSCCERHPGSAYSVAPIDRFVGAGGGRAEVACLIESDCRLSGERRRVFHFEGSDELCGLRNPAESPLYGEQGGVVVDASQAGLGRAIGQ